MVVWKIRVWAAKRKDIVKNIRPPTIVGRPKKEIAFNGLRERKEQFTAFIMPSIVYDLCPILIVLNDDDDDDDD